MSARLTEIVIESTDPDAAARFWSEALGWDLHEHMPGNVPWMSQSGESGEHDLKLVFVAGRQGQIPGMRLYLNPVGCELAEEIDRLSGLGATTDGQRSNTPWVAMVDPAGTGLTLLPSRID
jgi:catechol 2,3-dioxygenase-like lactoylglutathione lyase family enzyme